jgi:hypothetical protein
MLRASPESLGGDCRALGHRAQLLERNVGIEFAVAGKGPEAAIAAGNDALAADDIGEAANALGDKIGVLDIVGGGVEHARHQDLVVGQLCLLPHRPFMSVPRVGGLDDKCLRS